jgi:16S rRNA (guanine(966)-N(2))-methyltransferase RsmD
MDRVKENLFNILGESVVGTRWLDLFAGTGQVGIEALSRGADCVVFVDKMRSAANTVRANLNHTSLVERAEVFNRDAFDFLREYAEAPFDLVYVAPPQYLELWLDTLNLMDERPSGLLTPDGIVVVQIDPKEYRDVALINFRLSDQRRYGNTQLCFYERS